MRLIKLKIKNIASLKGEHEIDFGDIQNQSPLFAITGETGAGKSSILNAIGLVLYGKVYKSGITQNDLVTLGEKEGQIELIFQVQGKNYLAYWKAKIRKQNGELYATPQPPQRELYTLEGGDFEAPKTILTINPSDLLNLDFDQFCKCIILNQGEFARFLSSSFTERKEILEKLYPGEMLENLSRTLRGELDLLQKHKNDLDIELQALKGDGPQGEDLQVEKNRLETEYKQHESWLNTLESIEYHFISLHSYHGKNQDTQNKIDAIKATLSKETVVLNQLLNESEKQFNELTLVQKKQDQELPKLQELLKIEQTLEHTKEQKAKTLQILNKHQEQLTNLMTKSEFLKPRLKTWETKFSELTTSFNVPLEALKQHIQSLNTVFDLYTKANLLEQELKSKNERLLQLETQGKEEARELKLITDKKISSTQEKAELEELEIRKKEVVKAWDEKQRASIKADGLKTNIAELLSEKNHLETGLTLSLQELTKAQQEYLPLETTIKLQSLLNAVEICLTHPTIEESKACPVCHNHMSDELLSSLKTNLQKTDFTQLKNRENELSRLMYKHENEIQQFRARETQILSDVATKQNELNELTLIINKEIEKPEFIEELLSETKKKIWEQEQLLKDEQRLAQNLSRTREQYGLLKGEISLKLEAQLKLKAKIAELTHGISFISELNEASIEALKNESTRLQEYLKLEAEGAQLKQEKNYLDQNIVEATENLNFTQKGLKEIDSKASGFSSILEKELKDKKASELITELTQAVKAQADVHALKERELKAQELKLKESQSRLYNLDELIKEIDLQFTKEIHALRDLAHVSLPSPSEDLTVLIHKLKDLGLELSSPQELFIPLKDLIEAQKNFYKEKTTELKMNYASVRARYEDWEKRQDRIALLQLKLQDITHNLDRRNRLYEVLGKDELRTFVLSLVEESLITQTNEELQKLCQGRYEIVHQSRRMKLTPEFYILTIKYAPPRQPASYRPPEPVHHEPAIEHAPPPPTYNDYPPQVETHREEPDPYLDQITEAEPPMPNENQPQEHSLVSNNHPAEGESLDQSMGAYADAPLDPPPVEAPQEY